MSIEILLTALITLSIIGIGIYCSLLSRYFKNRDDSYLDKFPDGKVPGRNYVINTISESIKNILNTGKENKKDDLNDLH